MPSIFRIVFLSRFGCLGCDVDIFVRIYAHQVTAEKFHSLADSWVS